MKELLRKLSEIQKKLKAPKNQYNSFGQYNYRNCEDILEAVKPYLDENTSLTLSDDIIQIGSRIYVKATATFYHNDEKLEVTAQAREVEEKKKMDAPQCTGTASSYARKYALNGLFLIDDTKDPDSNEYEQINRNNNQQNNNRNQKNQSNNQKQNNQYNKKADWHTDQLRNLISSITSNFKDKTKINIICQTLNVRDLSVLAEYNKNKKKEIIDYLKKKFK